METVVHYRTSTEAFREDWHGYCTHIILHNVYEFIVLSCKQLQYLGRYACPPFWKPYLDIFWKLLRKTFRSKKDETSKDRKLQHNEKLRGLYRYAGVKYKTLQWAGHVLRVQIQGTQALFWRHLLGKKGRKKMRGHNYYGSWRDCSENRRPMDLV